MADDSDAVVSARIELLDYLRKRGLLFPGMDERNHEPHELLDALIAAVRAEGRTEIAELTGIMRRRLDAVRAEKDTTRCYAHASGGCLALERLDIVTAERDVAIETLLRSQRLLAERCQNTKSCNEPCEDVDGLDYCLRCGLWKGAR